MMLERPSLHALAVYVAVIEHGTMTAAAEAEGISQPAISAQVKSLERYFDTPLLERQGRTVCPTVAGQIVAEFGRSMLRLADDLNRSVESLDSLQSGRLIIGASSTVGEQLLPDVLGEFHRLYPGVELSLSIGNTLEITQSVRSRSLDLGIVGDLDSGPDLVTRPVFDDRLEIFVAPDSRIAQRNTLHVADLAAENFLLREPGSTTRDLALACLLDRGCRPAKVIELGSNEAVKQAVHAGLGVGILSVHAIRADEAAGRITVLSCQDWDCRRSFWLIHRRGHLLTRAEQAFLDILQIRYGLNVA